MVIDLTNSERSTFRSFLLLYLGSSLILMLFIGFFYFQNEERLYFDLTKSNMQNKVSKISAQIVYSHMTNSKFDDSKLLDNKKYKIAFYDENKNKIFGNLENKINFSKNTIQNEKSFILIDDSALGHLGVFYIAIEEHIFFQQINDLKINIFFYFIIIYSIIALIGFYLAKLFLKPIKAERIKLNNFIKDTTHELNTPISAILMSTENENLNEKQIQRVRLSVKRISEIYKDLIYIFLQNQNEVKIKERISLDKVLKEQLEYLGPLAQKKKINIILDIENFEYIINKDDFIRIVNNLISNAIKYNKIAGEIRITLKNKTLTISDTGIGIDEKKLKDIYKRYFRATKEQGGFGIGLSIVNHICNEYNIKINVHSQIKKGTSFTLSF